jgi:hypothetical protein
MLFYIFLVLVIMFCVSVCVCMVLGGVSLIVMAAGLAEMLQKERDLVVDPG